MARGIYISNTADLSDVPAPEAFYTYALPAMGANQGKLMVYNGTIWTTTGTASSLIVKEIDGTPTVSGVTTLQVSNTTLTDNGSGTVTVTTGGGGGGGSSRSGVDPATASYMRDDFQIGTTVGGAIGELRWTNINTAIIQQTSETNHPGIIRASSNVASGVCLKPSGGRTDQFLFADSFDMFFIFRANGTLANSTNRFGIFLFSTAETNNPPTDGIFFERLGADTNWFGVTRAASTQTRTNTAVAANNNFMRFRIRRIDASTIGFTIDGNAEVTATTNVPTGACYVNIQMFPLSGTQAADIDFFDLLISITR